MIRYMLKCDQSHQFESWFQSARAFETLSASGHISCAVCGSDTVTKAIMAPRVSTARTNNDPAAPERDPSTALSAPQTAAEAALAEMRKHVEATSDYVGSDFAREARDMHLGDAPERSIYGSAGPEEAKALIDEGVPVLPLPFMPRSRSN